MCVAWQEFFCNPGRYVHWWFQVKYISRNWELTLRDGYGLEKWAEVIHERKENRVFHQDLHCAQGMWVEGEVKT